MSGIQAAWSAVDFLSEQQQTERDVSRSGWTKRYSRNRFTGRRQKYRILREHQGDGIFPSAENAYFGHAILLLLSPHSLTVTVLTSVYCWRPYSPNSRPIPDCLKPPNGAAASKTS